MLLLPPRWGVAAIAVEALTHRPSPPTPPATVVPTRPTPPMHTVVAAAAFAAASAATASAIPSVASSAAPAIRTVRTHVAAARWSTPAPATCAHGAGAAPLGAIRAPEVCGGPHRPQRVSVEPASWRPQHRPWQCHANPILSEEG